MRRISMTVLMCTLSVSPALAYVGPGLGLGAIGAFLGAVLAVLLAIVGFLWYPIKRLLRKRKRHEETLADDTRAGPDA
jgi:Kef-type K+ transport system membrane component KefB